MTQQIMVIGLGVFGMALARTLAEHGADVIAVDARRERTDEAASFAAEALCIDATDEAELAKLNPAQRDLVVCTMSSSRESSILCTALLRQMGAKRIAARAQDKLHARILKLVGAHLIVNPEEEIANRFASQLLFANLLSASTYGKDLHLSEIILPDKFVGKSLVQLALPSKYGVIVAAVRRGTPPETIRPAPAEPLRAGDHLFLVCDDAALAQFLKEANS